jgi:RNA polymerase sigma-70 factor (ECF subfamily)
LSDQGASEPAIELDQAFLEALRGDAAGRRRAIERLYAAFAGRLRRYYLRRRATPAQAEDWTQETFVRVLRSAAEFRGEGGQFAAWLWTIARNVARDAVRHSSSQPMADVDELEGDDVPVQEGADPLTRVEEESVADCVRRGFREFARTHPERAECLSWLATDRMDIAGVAAVLGRTVAATREYLSQCRKKLRPFIEHCLAAT